MTRTDELVDALEKALTSKIQVAAEQLEQEVALAEGELRYGATT